MKKAAYILFLTFVLVSCDPPAGEFNKTITTSVADIEILVSKNDAAVLSALENNQPDNIISVTKITLTQMLKELGNIQTVAVPKNGAGLKTATESYIESLENFVKTQSAYADYTPEISADDVEKMDEANMKALQEVEKNRKRYVEYQKAFVKSKGI